LRLRQDYRLIRDQPARQGRKTHANSITCDFHCEPAADHDNRIPGKPGRRIGELIPLLRSSTGGSYLADIIFKLILTVADSLR